MGYIVQADIETRITHAELVQLTDDNKTGDVDQTVLAAEIASAEAMVESYCGQRYGLPLPAASTLVDSLALDIVVYKLFDRRHRISDSVRITFEAAVALLRDISTGKATLDAAASAAGPTTALAVKETDIAEVFSEDHLQGYA